MRHKYNKLLELNTGAKKKSVFIRGLLTSLVQSGKVTTTPKRAKVLKAEADSFFFRLVNYFDKYDEKAAKREAVRYVKSVIYGNEDWKKVIEQLLPKYLEEKRKTSFVSDYKVGFRKGDSVEKIMIELL